MAVQEIWDEIVDHVQVRKDLKSVALVSRAFVFRAQMRLFRYILVWEGRGKIYHLTKMQESSPHLLLHIRDLEIKGCNVETLRPIAQLVPLLRLDSISFGFMSYAAGEQGELLNLLSNLVALPTIRLLSFQHFAFAQFKHEVNLLSTLLASCNSAVRSIGFFACLMPSWSNPTSVTSLPRRPCITSLRLDSCEYPLDVFDLPGLTHARARCISDVDNAGIEAFLHKPRNTLTHLDLGGSGEQFWPAKCQCKPMLT